MPDPELSDRCFLLWVGRSLEQPDGFWDLARPVVEPAHKLAGTKSYVADLAALPQVRHTTVEVLSNNSTTVSYINKQGGTHSLTLCRLALEFLDWCDEHCIRLVAVHLQETKNVLADALSRGNYV